MPAFPHGPTTMVKVDFWGLSPYSKYPEAAWELFQFVTTTKEMQELNIRTNLVGLALVALWPFWEEFVRQIAPSLRDTHLHYYPKAAQYAHGHVYFKYERPQANNLIAGGTPKLAPAGTVGVTTVLRELTARINALEPAGAANAAAVARSEAVVRGAQRHRPVPRTPGRGHAPAGPGKGRDAGGQRGGWVGAVDEVQLCRQCLHGTAGHVHLPRRGPGECGLPAPQPVGQGGAWS